jgi:hypothetical protein
MDIVNQQHARPHPSLYYMTYIHILEAHQCGYILADYYLFSSLSLP